MKACHILAGNKAMCEKISALHDNDTWIFIELPAERKSVGSKWAYTMKFETDGLIERLKAELVANKYN